MVFGLYEEFRAGTQNSTSPTISSIVLDKLEMLDIFILEYLKVYIKSSKGHLEKPLPENIIDGRNVK